MDKRLIVGGAVSGILMTAGIVGAVSAQTLATETGLTEEQAIEIALMEVSGEVQEVELEREDGRMVYEISIQADDDTEMEVEVAADTGDVLEIEAEGEDCDKDGKA
jgi:uncharacterized membrane protein YkoI